MLYYSLDLALGTNRCYQIDYQYNNTHKNINAKDQRQHLFLFHGKKFFYILYNEKN